MAVLRDYAFLEMSWNIFAWWYEGSNEKKILEVQQECSVYLWSRKYFKILGKLILINPYGELYFWLLSSLSVLQSPNIF